VCVCVRVYPCVRFVAFLETVVLMSRCGNQNSTHRYGKMNFMTCCVPPTSPIVPENGPWLAQFVATSF
jgi:hypothetical protein